MNARLPQVRPRHAVYFAPDARHPLWVAGCAWLGRDARTVPAPPPARPGVLHPWRYGWHATLKAPMQLVEGASEVAWLDAVASLAARHTSFDMPALHIAPLVDFLAVQPRETLAAQHPLRRLADDCVLSLDRFRAPHDAAERARQERGAISERQREQARRLGYAHVLDDWRFHMTLTDGLGGLTDEAVASVRDEADRHFAAALAEPLRCDALCVFVEPAPGAPFEWRHRFALAAR